VVVEVAAVTLLTTVAALALAVSVQELGLL
jgi:hypothetical protein